uniref:Nucleoplasmin-like domain-containing protein n=1 Tax=Glycine max TaxID=3847 RepID=K7KFY2_SOYBN
MEFWGVEVKSGESLKVDPGDDKIIHLSNACLGDVTKDKEGLPVALYVKFGNQKLVLGTLSSEAFPQISYDLVFEKEFELSHNWKHGSVFFTGFKAQSQSESDNDEDSDDFDEDIPVSAANGKPEIEVKNGIKPDANEAKQKKIANGEDEDSSESESDDDSSEDQIARMLSMLQLLTLLSRLVKQLLITSSRLRSQVEITAASLATGHLRQKMP